MQISEFWQAALINTAFVAVGVTFVAGLLAVPYAWLLERTDLPGRRVLGALVTFPYVLPSYLLAIAWIVLANPAVGWLNLLGQKLFGLEGPWIDIYGMPGIIFIEATALFPIVFVSFRAGLQRLDPSLEDAARMSGAGPLGVFFRVTAPLLKNTYLAALIAVLLASIASFGVPAMIGAPGRRYVLTTALYSLVKQGSEEALIQAFEISAALAVFAVLFVILSQFLTRKKAALVGGVTSRPSITELGVFRLPVAIGAWGLALILIALPLAALVLSGFQESPGALTLDSFGLSKWTYVLTELPGFRSAVWTSLSTSLLAALFVVVFSLLVAILAWTGHYGQRRRWKNLARFLDGLAALAYSTPGTVLALVLIFFWVSVPSLSLANTSLALTVAFIVKYQLLGLKTVEPAAFLVHPALIEAAKLSGAGRRQTLWRIWIPLLRPALLGAGLLVFMPALSELTMSILLHGPGTENLGVLLFQLQEYADRSSAAVIGTLLLGTLLVFNVLAGRLTRES